MAFIYEEERKFDFNNEKEKFIAGPGQYLPLTEKKVYKESVAPFESSCLRLNEKTNKTPGPGTYYVDASAKEYSKLKENEKILQIEKIGSIITDNIQTTKDNALVTEIRQAKAKVRKNYERLGFSVKTKRFRDDPLISYLGPGYYLDQNTQNEQRAISARCQQMKNKVVKLQPGQIKGYHDNIPSIPQKETYGFAIDKNGNTLTRKINPENFKYFSGIKGDTVGPGSYDIDFPEQWHRSGTNWFKRKETQSKKDNQGAGDILNELKQSNHNLHSKENYYDNEIEQGKKFGSLSKVSLKQLMKRDLENKTKHKVSINKHHNKNNNDYPGPGFYFDIQLHSEFVQPQPYDDKRIFFGSKKERSTQIQAHNNENQLLGPGSYFNYSKNKLANHKNNNSEKPKNKKVPFASNSGRFSASTQSSLKLPGPGTYESESVISSNHFSKTSTAFYAHQQRFIESKKELERIRQIPGPGSYLDAFSNTGSSNTVELNGRFIDSRKAQEFSRKRAQTATKPIIMKHNSGGAAVGEYNPGYAMTIEYQNIKNCISQKREVAFNSSCSYKSNQPIKQDVGPGSYLIDSFTEVNQRKIPFNHSTTRYMPKKGKTKQETKEIIGPGLYDYDELYSWHKKSFNIKYL